MSKFMYISENNNNIKIECITVGDCATLYIDTNNYSDMREVFILLRTCIRELQKLMITKIAMPFNDTDDFLVGTSWKKFVNFDKTIYIICPIGEYMENMGKSLSITNEY